MTTLFEQYHPIVLFTFFASVISLSMFIMHPVYLIIALCGAMSINLAFRRRRFWKDWKLYVPLFFIMACINPLISHNGQLILFYMNGNAVTVEAIVYGVAMATMLTTVMLLFSSYNTVMTSDKFLYLFSKFSPALALTVSITMRLVPHFKMQLGRIAQAQKTLRMDYTAGSLLHRAKCSMRIISILITWSLENAIETADSMKARGYGIGKRTTFSLFVWERRDTSMLLFIVACAIALLIGSLNGYMTFYYYPTFTAIHDDPLYIVFYCMYAALLFLPVAVELKGAYTWHKLKSNM